jgi:FtsH-binding integral membrane protein
MTLFYIFAALVAACLATAALMCDSKTRWLVLNAASALLLAISMAIFFAVKKIKRKLNI